MPDESKHYVGQVSEHAVIFNGEGKILLIQHNGGGRGAVAPDTTNIHYGKWHMPGGRMDKEDQPEEGLLREIFEETGLKNVEIILPCHTSRWGFSEPIKYAVTYLARVSGVPEVTLPEDECAMDWKWFAMNEIENLEFLGPLHLDIIQNVAGWAKKLGVI